jgi:hypothetical protein
VRLGILSGDRLAERQGWFGRERCVWFSDLWSAHKSVPSAFPLLHQRSTPWMRCTSGGKHSSIKEPSIQEPLAGAPVGYFRPPRSPTQIAHHPFHRRLHGGECTKP